MRTTTTILFGLIFTFPASSQPDSTTNGIGITPALGWEHFQNSVEYPELAKRAALTGVVVVYIQIDSSGTIDSLGLFGIGNETGKISVERAEIFIRSLRRAIRATSWSSPLYRKKDGGLLPSSSHVSFSVIFDLHGYPGPLIIEQEKPLVRIAE